MKSYSVAVGQKIIHIHDAVINVEASSPEEAVRLAAEKVVRREVGLSIGSRTVEGGVFGRVLETTMPDTDYTLFNPINPLDPRSYEPGLDSEDDDVLDEGGDDDGLVEVD